MWYSFSSRAALECSRITMATFLVNSFELEERTEMQLGMLGVLWNNQVMLHCVFLSRVTEELKIRTRSRSTSLKNQNIKIPISKV